MVYVDSKTYTVYLQRPVSGQVDVLRFRNLEAASGHVSGEERATSWTAFCQETGYTAGKAQPLRVHSRPVADDSDLRALVAQLVLPW